MNIDLGIKGFAQRRIDRDAWEIGIYSKDMAYTFEIKSQPVKDLERITTIIPNKDMDILRGLAQALQEIGIYPQQATASELKATKYHLEDMRILAMRDLK